VIASHGSAKPRVVVVADFVADVTEVARRWTFTSPISRLFWGQLVDWTFATGERRQRNPIHTYAADGTTRWA